MVRRMCDNRDCAPCLPLDFPGLEAMQQALQFLIRLSQGAAKRVPLFGCHGLDFPTLLPIDFPGFLAR